MEATDVNHHVDASSNRVIRAMAPTSMSGIFTDLDLQALRLLLSGGSVVDWRRLSFREAGEVAEFLAANGYDVDNSIELGRLGALHIRALDYLERTYELSIPARVRTPKDVTELFLTASGVDADESEQQAACAVLKVVHVINHLEARRLVHHLSLSERALFLAAANKVDALIGEMQTAGFGISEYEPSTKTDDSLITKLISKPRVTAAQIFDKLRFRLVTESRDDLLPVVRWLLRQLFPFNHVIAGESHNTILTEEELRDCLDPQLERPYGEQPGDFGGYKPNNPATSPNFRMINFVVDLPVRINRLCTPGELVRLSHLGHLVHVTLEFQLFDRETLTANEAGEGNHGAYKQRQLNLVSERLWGGLKPRLSAGDRVSRRVFDDSDED
jgi:uncharacterized protein (TIGR04552 family)